MRFGTKAGPSRTADYRYSTHEPIRTDREGRFRVEALPPGYPFQLWRGEGESLLDGDGLRWGQTKDLGDVRMKGHRALTDRSSRTARRSLASYRETAENPAGIDTEEVGRLPGGETLDHSPDGEEQAMLQDIEAAGDPRDIFAARDTLKQLLGFSTSITDLSSAL